MQDESRASELNANSDFFDNSSAALDLGYSATGIRSAHPDDKAIVPALTPTERIAEAQERDLRAERFQSLCADLHAAELAAAGDRREAERDPEGNVIPFNRGAYADWEKRTRELEADGYTTADAQRIARSEIHPEETADPERPDYLGASVESLMHRRVDVRGGSHSGRKFGEPKTGSKMCRRCGLERKCCGCYSGRNETVTARVTQTVKDELALQDVSAGEIVEAVMRAAIDAGGAHLVRTILDRTRRAFALRDPNCPRCVALGEHLACPTCTAQWQRARGIA